MQYFVKSVDDYIKSIPEDRVKPIESLREVIKNNLPKGFEEIILYGMICYVIPLSIYPKGYHTKKDEPLTFMGIASQKNHISLYHMGMYQNSDIDTWFTTEYAKIMPTKIERGKGCIRFKNFDNIPYELIGELCTKISLEKYIESYEKNRGEENGKKS